MNFLVTRAVPARVSVPSAANAADYYRRATGAGYAAATGVLTHDGPSYTINPLANGDSGYFEVMPHDPRVMNRAIENGLTRRCSRLHQDDVVTNGESRYTVGSSPLPTSGLTDPDQQIMAIEQVIGTEPNATIVPWAVEGNDWWGQQGDGTVYLRFDAPPTGTIRITWRDELSAWSDDDTDTKDRDLAYMKWAAFVELYSSLAASAVAGSQSEIAYKTLRTAAYEQYWGERLKAMTSLYAGDVIVRHRRPRIRTAVPRMGRL